jgi:hypothetical protein
MAENIQLIIDNRYLKLLQEEMEEMEELGSLGGTLSCCFSLFWLLEES